MSDQAGGETEESCPVEPSELDGVSEVVGGGALKRRRSEDRVFDYSAINTKW